MILTIFLGIFWLMLVPFGLGIAPSRLLPKEYRMPGMIFAIGYLIMMALFECVYLPALLLHMHFQTLCLIFRLSVGFLSLASVIFGAKEITTYRFPKMNPFMIVFIVMVILQCVARWFQGVTDGDDAYFLGTAVNAYFGNQINNVDPYTGFQTTLDIRHALSPGGIWVAYLANCIKLHPAITAHIVYADIAIILHNIVIYHIGQALLIKDEHKAALFAVFFGLFDIFGHLSYLTPATFFITRTWQGKSVVVNFCIPFALFLMLMLIRDELTVKQWKEKLVLYGILSGCTMLAGFTLATTGLILLPPFILIGAVFVSIYRKKISAMLPAVLACVPVGLMSILFVILK